MMVSIGDPLVLSRVKMKLLNPSDMKVYGIDDVLEYDYVFNCLSCCHSLVIHIRGNLNDMFP